MFLCVERGRNMLVFPWSDQVPRILLSSASRHRYWTWQALCRAQPTNCMATPLLFPCSAVKVSFQFAWLWLFIVAATETRYSDISGTPGPVPVVRAESAWAWLTASPDPLELLQTHFLSLRLFSKIPGKINLCFKYVIYISFLMKNIYRITFGSIIFLRLGLLREAPPVRRSCFSHHSRESEKDLSQVREFSGNRSQRRQSLYLTHPL